MKPFLVDGEAAAFRVTVTFAFDDEDWRVDAGRMTAKATLGEKFAQLFLLDEIQLILGRRENLRRYRPRGLRSEEHTSELQSLMRISYAVFCLKQKKKIITV